MGRILALDYGSKRTGIAVSDPEKIIATPYSTIPTQELESFLKNYTQKEIVDTIVVGEPKSLGGGDTDASAEVRDLVLRLKGWFPALEVVTLDERFTSKIALDSMIMGGTSKKRRREKGNIDKTSAVIILQDYMTKQGT